MCLELVTIVNETFLHREPACSQQFGGSGIDRQEAGLQLIDIAYLFGQIEFRQEILF